MSIPVYTDFIIKYSDEKKHERNPFSLNVGLSDDSYYEIFKKTRFIDVSEMLNSLYEDKFVSYIRTDTRLMSVEHFDDRFAILDAISESCFDEHPIRQLLTRMDMNLMKEGCWVENLNVAHYALTPTSYPIEMNTYFNTRSRPYEAIRKNIYIDICKAYINLFIPD